MNYKHGYTLVAARNSENAKWRTHYIWLSMKQRCLDPNWKQFKDYGGRGISFDPRWAEFENFLLDMGEPAKGMTLDRKDNDGPYNKDNCQWATRASQNRNKRSNRYLEFNGERRMVVDWAKHLGVPHRLLRVRLWRGWSVERTLGTPIA